VVATPRRHASIVSVRDASRMGSVAANRVAIGISPSPTATKRRAALGAGQQGQQKEPQLGERQKQAVNAACSGCVALIVCAAMRRIKSPGSPRRFRAIHAAPFSVHIISRRTLCFLNARPCRAITRRGRSPRLQGGRWNRSQYSDLDVKRTA
jgi:hypothetical protein